MRSDPDRRAAARTRLLAMTTGMVVPGGPVQRRTAARRAGLTCEAREALARLPDGRFRLAADPAALDRLLSLAAAIELAQDIAAVIDREGRDRLDAALGADIRAMAVAARALSGPRLRRSAEALAEAHAAEREASRAVWFAGFPPGLRLADGEPDAARPDPARRDRLAAALAHVEEALLGSGTAERAA